ncbi:fimbrial protein [Lelliottia nimipressuralis]|uniref:Type 1 fimbrial protein n=1 Tax=Lelliottia nimipressuralis TaxID=69220 RepID=A0ABD4KHC8_9ENTR|nr:fimbrial protein [Lelliottia nimipressuralis]MBF4180416.1 type 1 fimbrial protein [Lelliottia nimipressuralis]
MKSIIINSKLVPLALLGAVALSGSAAVFAGGGDSTLNFSGSVVDQTCAIDATDKTLTIDFGTASLATFNADGGSSEQKTIKINLASCPATVTSATVTFTGQQATNGDNSYLATVTDAGAATNVAIQFADATGATPIDLNTASAATPIVEGDNTLAYTAMLANPTGTATPATAGTISATAQYSINYQ